MLANQNVTAASGGNEDLADLGGLLHGGHLETSHGSLEGVDGINLGDEHTSTHTLESESTALANITETSNNTNLASNHHVGGALDAVNEGLAAAVQVVELGLGDRVVDVDGRNKELALLEHAVEVVNTSGGLLRDTVAVGEHLGVLGVDQVSEITTVVKDKVQLLIVLEGNELLLQAPVVFLLGLALPGEDRHTGGSNGGSGVVLGAEDVAGSPGNLSTEGGQGLDEDSSLDGHVEAASNAGALERLVGSILQGELETL